jgi:hypothetical protein
MQKGTIEMKYPIGTTAVESGTNTKFEVIGHTKEGLNLLKVVSSTGYWKGQEGRDVSYLGGFYLDKGSGFSNVVTPPKKTKNKTKGAKRPLFLVATKNGMTHKGLASLVNKRKVDTFGNSVTHALSKWEDKFGDKIPLEDAVVFKLVPHTVRIDGKNGRARLGKEIK